MAEEVLELRRLLDRLDGRWRKELADGDGRGAAGAEADLAIGSTAAWLRAGSTWGPARPEASCGPLGPWSAVPSLRPARAVCAGGCVFPDCAQPLAWCEGHHLVSWLDGGPSGLPTSPGCVGRIIGRSTRRAGDSPELPTGGSPPSHPIDDPGDHRRQPAPV